MPVRVEPVPVLLVRHVADLRPQHGLPVPVWDPLAPQDRRPLSPGVARAVGTARPTIQLSVLEHDVCECRGRRAGDVVGPVLDLGGREGREVGWEEVEGEKAGAVDGGVDEER
ncbi:hypothetical protein FOPE_08395 [Fonsecaea pedrosoi]|nr:hypothetical protein FOPE_08395 [Fonsecaea pedrosoi]